MRYATRNTYTIDGSTVNDAKSVEFDNVTKTSKTVPKAVAAQLTTRTSDSVGVITLPAGHGIANGSKVDLYWGTTNLRKYADAAVVGNALTLSNGAGDVLPTNLTSITVAVTQVEPFSVDHSLLQVLIAGGNTARSSIRFQAADDSAEEYAVNLAAGRAFYWDTEAEANGFTNPFDEQIGTVRFSHANTASSELMQVIAGVSN
jgi:hypothetical protein